jgi:hypothetical protein
MRHHDVVTSTMPEPTGRPNARLAQTVGDMGRSLAVVLAAVAVIMFITHRAEPDPVREVSITTPLMLANMQSRFPVEVPQGLEGYRLTSARFTGAQTPVWHLGYVTPETQYVEVEQSATKTLKFLESQLANTSMAGSVEINGATWNIYDGASKRALVRQKNGVTTAVSGTASLNELKTVAGTLASQKQTQL